ncbi:hypothetical protein B0T17DRAFT_501272, partial [Bombardia bombarda]
TGSRTSVRTLPFTKEVFKLITERFHTHGSIARVVSQSDIPAYSSTELHMGTSSQLAAHVNIARTVNAWKLDLALASTYFPVSGLNYGIVFGCTLGIEDEILRRLSFSSMDAAHPLLMFGIIAEIERSRHIKIVEDTIIGLETRIFELDHVDDTNMETHNYEKRDAYLDTAYLRDQLTSWTNQLLKMKSRAEELDEQGYPKWRGMAFDGDFVRIRFYCKIGREYHSEIRECTMRLDGMAMATQWADGETNVQIALEMKRDSKHMRSIALVTMIFLPGTFFASIFSMTFFNWSPNNDANDNGDGWGGPGQLVSSYIWIYILFATVATGATVLVWWYCVVFRESRARRLRG